MSQRLAKKIRRGRSEKIGPWRSFDLNHDVQNFGILTARVFEPSERDIKEVQRTEAKQTEREDMQVQSNLENNRKSEGRREKKGQASQSRFEEKGERRLMVWQLEESICV